MADILAPVAANRAVALLSKAMSLAIKWGWRADNPAGASSAIPRSGASAT